MESNGNPICIEIEQLQSLFFLWGRKTIGQINEIQFRFLGNGTSILLFSFSLILFKNSLESVAHSNSFYAFYRPLKHL